jgi:hypothetical protein
VREGSRRKEKGEEKGKEGKEEKEEKNEKILVRRTTLKRMVKLRG